MARAMARAMAMARACCALLLMFKVALVVYLPSRVIKGRLDPIIGEYNDNSKY